MNTEVLITHLNKLERWLESSKGKHHLLPLRGLGYSYLALVLMISNFGAVVRWPFASLKRKLDGPGSALDTDISGNKPIDVDPDMLDNLIHQKEKVLVDFWAEWCGTCIMMNGPIKRLAKSTGEQYIIAKVDTVKHAQPAEQHNVKGLPTLILFNQGEEIKRYAGALSYSELKAFIGD